MCVCVCVGVCVCAYVYEYDHKYTYMNRWVVSYYQQCTFATLVIV